MLWEMFKQQGSKFSREYTSRTQISSWDNRKQGYITYNRIHQLAQNVALYGPVGGIMGRHVEHELLLNPMTQLLSTSLMEKAQKENKVLKDTDLEPDSWSYWDRYQPGQEWEQPPGPSSKSGRSTPTPSVTLIPTQGIPQSSRPPYTDIRERRRSRDHSRRASSINSDGSWD